MWHEMHKLLRIQAGIKAGLPGKYAQVVVRMSQQISQKSSVKSKT